MFWLDVRIKRRPRIRDGWSSAVALIILSETMMKTHMACAEFNYYFTNICYVDGNTRQFHGSALVSPVMVNETIGPIGYMLDKEESTAWWNMFLTFSSDDPDHTLNKELQNRLAETGELVFPGGEYMPGWPQVRSYFYNLQIF